MLYVLRIQIALGILIILGNPHFAWGQESHSLLLIAHEPEPEQAFITDLVRVIDSLTYVGGTARTPRFSQISYFNRLTGVNRLLNQYNRELLQNLDTEGIAPTGFTDRIDAVLREQLLCPGEVVTIRRDPIRPVYTLERYAVDSCLASYDFLRSVLVKEPEGRVNIYYAGPGTLRPIQEGLSQLFPQTNQPARISLSVAGRSLANCDQEDCQANMRSLDSLIITAEVQDEDSKLSSLRYFWYQNGTPISSTNTAAYHWLPTGHDTTSQLSLWVTDGIDSSAHYTISLREVAPPDPPTRFTNVYMSYIQPYERWNFYFIPWLFLPNDIRSNIGNSYPPQFRLVGEDGKKISVIVFKLKELTKPSNLVYFQSNKTRTSVHNRLVDSLARNGLLPDQALFVYWDYFSLDSSDNKEKSMWYYIPHKIPNYTKNVLSWIPKKEGLIFPNESRNLIVGTTTFRVEAGASIGSMIVPTIIRNLTSNVVENSYTTRGLQLAFAKQIYYRKHPMPYYFKGQLTLWPGHPNITDTLSYFPFFPEIQLSGPIYLSGFRIWNFRCSIDNGVGYQRLRYLDRVYHILPFTIDIGISYFLPYSNEIKMFAGGGFALNQINPEINYTFFRWGLSFQMYGGGFK